MVKISKTHSFFLTMIKYSIVSWISFLISLVSIPIMTRVFSPETMGGITIFQSVSSVFLIIALSGQDQAFSRFFFDKDSKGELAFKAYKIITFSWSILFIIIVLFSELLSRIIFSNVNSYAMIMTAFVALPLSYLRMSEQIYRMKSETRNYGRQQVIVNFITRLLVLASAFINENYNTYLTISVISSIFLALIFIKIQFDRRNIVYINHKKEKYSKEMINFGIPNMIAAISFSLKDVIPRIILSSYIGLYAVGIYSSAISLASLINILQAGFSTYFGAYFYENYKNENNKFNYIHHSLVFFLVLFGLTLIAFSDIAVRILGNEYISAARILPIIIWSPIAISISETTVYGINISKKTNFHIYISIITTLLTIILSVLLIPKYSELGAAFTIGVSGLLFLSLRTIIGFKYIKIVLDFNKTINSLLLLVIYSVSVIFFNFTTTIKFLMYFLMVVLLFINYLKYINNITNKFLSKGSV